METNKIKKMMNGEIDYLEGLGIIIGTQHIADTVCASMKIVAMDEEGYAALMCLLDINNEVKEKIFFDRLQELVADFNRNFGELCKELNHNGNITDFGDKDVMKELVKRMN